MIPLNPRPLPLPYGYWVPGADILAGEYPGTASGGADAEDKLRRLHAAGVTCFFDLTEEGELTPYAHLLAGIWGEDRYLYRRFPIRDASIPRDPAEMLDLLDRLDADLAMGHSVYLHCWGGVGRTGTVVGCFLVRRGRWREEALAEVARLFGTTTKGGARRSPETPEQDAYVLSWVEHDWLATSDGYPTTRLEDQVKGALLGLAAGDALGTTLEFRMPGTFEPITDMVGGGPFGLEPGAWTDDTSMVLCLAESLMETGSFDAADQMRRYVRWWREGHLSSTGTCFDIGSTTRAALARFDASGDPWAGSTDPFTAGNGSLMRLAPVVLWYRDDPAKAVRMAGESSRTTHGARTAVDACRYFAALLLGALHGLPREEFLSWGWVGALPFWRDEPLHPEVEAVARGSWRGKSADQIQASGYVLHTLEAALWAFEQAEDFRAGALAAVNLGNDADTTGAVYGQIAGAWFGEGEIPEAWRKRLKLRDRLEEFARAMLIRRRHVEGITPERMDELLAFLPVLETGGEALEARWDFGSHAEEGVVYSPWPEYPEVVEEFFRLAEQPWWRDQGYDPSAVHDVIDDPRRIATTSLAEIKSLLTYCVRGERFCPGHRDVMINGGQVAAVLRRLAVLRGR